MVSFDSGRWIVLLGVYFFSFFLIVFGIINANAEIGFTDSDISVDNTFIAHTASFNDTGESLADNPEGGFSQVTSSLAVMTGINAESVDIGFPSWAQFIFSFFLFWIPLVMLVWAIYTAIPFI